MRKVLLKAIAAAAAVGLAASAQAQDLPLIEAGRTVVGKPGKAGQADLYQFIGVMGSEVTISLEAPGKAAITLFTPTGDEMLTESGTGEMTLRAVLPLANAYTIAVSRSDLTKSYTLKLQATEPDMHQMFFSRNVGYELRYGSTFSNVQKSCWIDPGRKLRRIHPGAEEEASLGRGGSEYSTYKVRKGGVEVLRAYDHQVRFEEDAAIYTTRNPDGTTETLRKNLELDPQWAKLGSYISYLCK